MKVKIYVTLKPTVLDAQGQVVKKALENLGHTNLREVRIGKYIEISLEPGEKPVDQQVREMCDRLLANPVMEDYRFEIEESRE